MMVFSMRYYKSIKQLLTIALLVLVANHALATPNGVNNAINSLTIKSAEIFLLGDDYLLNADTEIQS
jgi:hypothetical protein